MVRVSGLAHLLQDSGLEKEKQQNSVIDGITRTELPALVADHDEEDGDDASKDVKLIADISGHPTLIREMLFGMGSAGL